MKKSKKIVAITVSIVMVLVAVFALGVLSFNIFKNKLENTIFPLKDPISVINAEYEKNKGIIVDWVYNPNDLEKVTGFADYVFVAEVTEVVGTGYTGVEMYNAFRFESNPFTRYKLRVLENLKGQLRTDEDITLTKHDGVNFFGKSVSFLEGDQLPDVGECYLFICMTDSDGELIIGQFSGGHSDIYLCKAGEYTGQSDFIDMYRDAIENMDESVRIGETYKSKYEVQ